MGKRELLIVVAFLAVGAVVYQFTASPPAEGRGFTLGRLIEEIRSDIRRDSSDASVTHSGSFAIGRDVEELRLSGVTGRVEVRGEDRDDVAYELRVRSTGPEPTLAEQYARRTRLVDDDLGDSLSLRVDYPDEGRQTSEITLVLPRRLHFRAEGASSNNSFTINNLDSIRLEAVVGEAVVDGVGEITGSHRNGRLTVTDARSVSLALSSSRASFTGIAGRLVLRATRGETIVDGATGSIEVEQTSNELRVVGHEGELVVTGSNGEVRVEQPRGEVRVDVRNADVEIALDAAVPVTVLSTGETIVVRLSGPPPIVLDARTTDGGEIAAEDFGLTPVVAGAQSSIEHAFDGARGARVLVRNRRGDIVIRRDK